MKKFSISRMFSRSRIFITLLHLALWTAICFYIDWKVMLAFILTDMINSYHLAKIRRWY